MKGMVWTLVLLTVAFLAGIFSIYVPSTKTYGTCYQGHQNEIAQNPSYKTRIIVVGICLGRAVRANETIVNVASTLAIAVFTIVLAITTVYLWIATRRAAEIAEATLVATRRPWISLEIEPAGQFVVDKHKRFYLHAAVTLRNIGETPATHVRHGIKFISGIDQMPSEMIAEEAARPSMGFMETLFPKDFLQVKAGGRWYNDAGEEIGITMLAWAIYRFTFGSDESHYTGKLFSLTSKDGMAGLITTSAPQFVGKDALAFLELETYIS